jgi:hypothetical protein
MKCQGPCGFPTIDSLLRSGVERMAITMSAMFLNSSARERSSVMWSRPEARYFPDGVPGGTAVLWERWTRCAMGLRPTLSSLGQGNDVVVRSHI